MMGNKRLGQRLILAMMTAAAIILHYVEGLFPVPVNVPGIKLGLSNVVSLVALYLFGPVPAFTVLVLRVLMTSFLYSGLSNAVFSMAGGILSVLAMTVVYRLREKGFSILSASVMGGIFHNIGQLTAAAVVLGTSAVFSYLPVLMASGIATGLATGLLAGILVPRLENIYSNNR